YAGNHQGSVFLDNTITSFQEPDTPSHLGQGLSIGSHPWPESPPDASRTNSSERAGTWITDARIVMRNSISGANVNLLIEGWGVPVKKTDGCNLNPPGPLCGVLDHVERAVGSVLLNAMQDPKQTGKDCPQKYNYAVNPEHALGDFERNDSNPDPHPFGVKQGETFTWDAGCI